MNYEQAMEYIHAVQWAGHKPGLTRTRTLLAALGDPHKQLRFVHVAGTNGKGSTAAMMASCLQAAGYRVGLYTSPFINRFNERIQINGVQIPDEELVRLVEQVKPAADTMEDVPTEFEIITALGMLYLPSRNVRSWCWRWALAARWIPPTSLMPRSAQSSRHWGWIM